MSGYQGTRRRRRRRRHRSAIRRTPEQLQQHGRRRRLDTSQLLACVAVGVICISLITLIWINTGRAVREQVDDTRGRVEAAITAQAATFSAQAQRELMVIDQSLSVLQAAWIENPDSFNLARWQSLMPALTAVADDVFIANDHHLIVQDIVPAAVGQGIGSAYATFANGSLEPIRKAGDDGRDNAMLVGELGGGAIQRQYLMYLVRPLPKPEGWVIGASYRSQALTNVFAKAGLGQGGLAALVDTHRGGVQALAGTAALRPRLGIDNTAMFKAMMERPDGGIWIGTTPIDGVDRIIAFRRIPGRDLLVMVGVVTADAMAPASSWAAGAHTLATLASLLILAIGATVLWEVWHWRRTRHRAKAMEQTRALLAGVQNELAATRLRANTAEARARIALERSGAGVAVVTAEHRLAAWNAPFAEMLLLPPDTLRPGVALDELLRQHLLAAQGDIEAELLEADVTARVAALLAGDGSGTCAATALDGNALALTPERMPDGTLVLILAPAGAIAPLMAEPEPADTLEL